MIRISREITAEEGPRAKEGRRQHQKATEGNKDAEYVEDAVVDDLPRESIAEKQIDGGQNSGVTDFRMQTSNSVEGNEGSAL